MGYRPRPHNPHSPGSAEHRQQKLIEALEEWHERWEKIWRVGDDNLLHERRYKDQVNAMRALHMSLRLSDRLVEIYSKGRWDGYRYARR